MNKDQRRRRRVGAATLLGLTAMLVGLIMAPSVGQAASTSTPVADSTWREVLLIVNPEPALTLREFQRMAERETGTSIQPSDLSVLVDGDKSPSTLLVSLVDGPGLDTTFDELTGGRHSDDEEVKVIIIIKCNKCNVG